MNNCRMLDSYEKGMSASCARNENTAVLGSEKGMRVSTRKPH